MMKHDVNCRSKGTLLRGALVAALLISVCMSCGGGEEMADSSPEQVAPDSTPSRTQPPPALAPKQMPSWVLGMRKWPSTIHWVLDSSLTYTMDDLAIRFRMSIVQDVGHLRFQNEEPLLPDILVIMSPIPEWRYAQTFNIDSLVVFDPVRNRRLTQLPILSFERSYEDETMRTQYYANVADEFRFSPELDDGQPVNPTLYMTWDQHLIIAEFPPVALTHVTDPTQGHEEKELPPDYRLTPGG